MLKVMLLIRDSYDARYILSKLSQVLDGVEIDVVLESGVVAKKKKLGRFFRKKPIWLFPIQCLNILAVVIYDHLMMRKIKKKLGEPSYPKTMMLFRVSDVNEEKCIEFVKGSSPDLILVYGTAILSQQTLLRVGKPLYNIHSSILPYYRNVHSDFWAYQQKDFERIGVSIIKLDSGIDTGDIVIQERTPIIPGDRLSDIKVKNIQLIPVLIVRLIEKFQKNAIQHSKQDISIRSFYPTPNIFQLIKLFFSKPV